MNIGAKDNARRGRVKQLAIKHDLAPGFSSGLLKLAKYRVVALVDDSASMMTPVPVDHDHPQGTLTTRWKRLIKLLEVVLGTACALNPGGMDIHYFNSRQPLYGIQSEAELHQYMKLRAPFQATPLVQRYQDILHEYLAGTEERILVLILTDGYPTRLVKGHLVEETSEFEQLLRTRAGFDPARCPTSLMMCSGVDVEWSSRLDPSIRHLDVVKEFATEENAVRRFQGGHFTFTLGDYIAKMMLGPLGDVSSALNRRPLAEGEMEAYLMEHGEDNILPCWGCCVVC